MTGMNSVRDEVAVETGGVRGLGRSFALALAAARYSVAVVARRRPNRLKRWPWSSNPAVTQAGLPPM